MTGEAQSQKERLVHNYLPTKESILRRRRGGVVVLGTIEKVGSLKRYLYCWRYPDYNQEKTSLTGLNTQSKT